MALMIDITHPAWLARIMAERNLKTGDLAERAGIDRATVQRIVKGEGGTLITVRAILRALEPTAGKEL